MDNACPIENDYFISIAKEELAKLPAATHSGSIRVIDREEQVDEAVSILRSAEIIGFDTETRPSFKRGTSYTVSLLQLSTPSVSFLFRINKIGLAQQLIDLLEDPEKLKVGLSIHDDFHNLNKLAELHPAGFVDLQQFVKQYRINDNSLSRIYGILFGKRISKGQRLTNWEATELSEHQQAYAALDAMACIDIYRYVSAGKFHPERSQYIRYPELSDNPEANVS